MRLPETEQHKVAIVRVEIRDRSTQDLLIELLEVVQEQEADRPLGSATSSGEACQVLAAWLGELTGSGRAVDPGSGGMTGRLPVFSRRTRSRDAAEDEPETPA